VLPRWLQLIWMLVDASHRVPRRPFPSSLSRDRLPEVPRVDRLPAAPTTTMRWLQTEYLLKGIYLGLVLFAALALASIPPGDSARLQDGLLRINLSALVGLALALGISAVIRLREGIRVGKRVFAFILFLLLEGPMLAYTGILAGTFVGIYLLDASQLEQLRPMLVPVVGGAALAGFVFGLLRQIRDRSARMLLVLLLAAGLVTAGLSWLSIVQFSWLSTLPTYQLGNPTAFAIQLLLGIPLFYLLTFAGQEEESEVEIGVICGLLGLGLALLVGEQRQFASLPFLIPVVLYFFYTLRVLPGLRVLKHAFRGLSYSRMGKYRRALIAFRRALQLEPNNSLAREGFWEVHRSLNFEQLADDPQMLALVDLDLCLDRAGTLLLSKPNAKQLEEANSLLDLVLRLAPARHPQVSYWRAVAATHAGELDRAAAELERLLDPEVYGADNPYRLGVLLPAWQLALMLHSGLRQRVGEPQLAIAGRRMDAIAAVERHLADNPNDPAVVPLKRLLYDGLTEAEYNVGAGGPDLTANYVDHAYLQHLGVGLIDDDTRWQRGGEYLRLAARGLPALGPSLFVQIAQAQQRAGHFEEARHNYGLARRAGQAVGPKNLDETQRQAYFATVKFLAEEALQRGDVEAAIENFRLYSESERSGIETLRTLASLYEQKGDVLAAARVTDQALQYNAQDADLLDRKDRYYYSIDPNDLKARLEHYATGFDVAYCLQKARTILDRYNDPDWLDVAQHLLTLALIVRPESLTAKVLLARVELRLGHRDTAIARLQEVRGPAKPERFASGEDEEAWYIASQLLGDLYLEMERPDLAIACLNDFRKSSRSGAKTLFKLAQAHEQLGDTARAIRCYEQVTAYQGNPLCVEAELAIQRLKG